MKAARHDVIQHWYGHLPGCLNPVIPAYRGPELLVCTSCMPDREAPTCLKCGVVACRTGPVEGFVHYAFTGFCPACVAKIRAAGPPRERRIRANQARVDALMERFPALEVTERARNRTQLDGIVEGRAVWLTIRVSTRGDSDERYVFRVELHEPVTTVDKADLRLESRLLELLSHDSPKITVNRHRWLHAGFRHLGKLDTVWVLEGLLATAIQLDGRT